MHIRPDLYHKQPRSELMGRWSGEAFQVLQAELEVAEEQLADFQCTICRAALAHRTPAPVDCAHKQWDEIDVYDCGYETFGGEVRDLCRSDPAFPPFTDYRLDYRQFKDGDWMVIAELQTIKARGLRLDPQCGASQEAALAELKDRYR